MKVSTVFMLTALLYVCTLVCAQDESSVSSGPSAISSVSSIGRASSSAVSTAPGSTPSSSVIVSSPSISLSRVPSILPTAAQPSTLKPTTKPTSDAVILLEDLKYTALFIALFNVCVILAIQ